MKSRCVHPMLALLVLGLGLVFLASPVTAQTISDFQVIGNALCRAVAPSLGQPPSAPAGAIDGILGWREAPTAREVVAP